MAFRSVVARVLTVQRCTVIISPCLMRIATRSTELADLAGVTPRTVRYYLAQGLLPAVGQTGPGSKYDEDHLARLRLIRRLQAEHLPLAEIRRRLDDLEPNEIRDLAGNPEPPAPPDSALDYLRTVLGCPAARSTDAGLDGGPDGRLRAARPSTIGRWRRR